MQNNVVCFTTHRLTYTAIRITGLDKPMVAQRIDQLHNLRLQYDRHKRFQGIPKRSYYLHAPKYAGGLNTRGRTPTHINRLIDMIRSEAEPAELIEWRTLDITDGVDIETLNDKSN